MHAHIAVYKTFRHRNHRRVSYIIAIEEVHKLLALHAVFLFINRQINEYAFTPRHFKTIFGKNTAVTFGKMFTTTKQSKNDQLSARN